MQHGLIIHEVDAYPAWKAIFDQAADIRKQAGEISYEARRGIHPVATFLVCWDIVSEFKRSGRVK